MSAQPEVTPPGAEMPAGETGGDDAVKPMRADARRNYERLVAAAKEVFATQGGDASMEAIAKHAGVGVGTLYRHFPKRIDVVEAVYRNDVDDLMLTAEKAMANLDPWPALVAYLDAFRRYAAGKRVFLNELHEAFEKNPQLKLRSRERIDQALGMLIDRAQAAGVVRTDVSGEDLMHLIGPLCTNATLSGDQGDRLLAMVLDGLRHPSI